MRVLLHVLPVLSLSLVIAGGTLQNQSRPASSGTKRTASAPKTQHRRYPLKGVVRSLVKEERLAMIRHEDIPGWMPPMTMEFEVKSAKDFAKLTKGMAIRATVVVADNGAYWLEDVQPAPRSR